MGDVTTLIGDIGGTNTRLALLAAGTPAFSRVLSNADYPHIDALVTDYLRSLDAQGSVRTAVLAVAGPVKDGRVTMTNLGWEIDAVRLADHLGLESVTLVNDFTALALGLPSLPKEALARIGDPDRPATGAAIAVLGPGTGLGVSGLIPADGGWAPIAGEGGHVTLAAVGPQEAALIDIVRRRFGHVSAERVLSGPGLEVLYEAISELQGRSEPAPSADQITTAALAGQDRLAMATLETFFEFLGEVSGNLALTLGAQGGVYLGGGILPRMIEALRASGFRRRFEDKGRYRSYLAEIPVYVICEPLPAYRGLITLAERPQSRHS